MSVTSGFFNSLDGDRKYSAEQFSAIYDGVINDGVFASIGNTFAVTAGTGVTINVDTGRAWFNGAWLYNDAILPITAEQSEVLLDRYDAVVIEIDHSLSVRNGSIKIVKGTPASSPSYPTMVSSEDVHQYPLAYIYRTAGSTTIAQGNITNAVGTSACPFVTGILQVQDIDQIVAQWQAQWLEWKANWDNWNVEWDTWFEDEKNQIDTEAYQWMLDSRANFTAWFNELETILDGDTATALAADVTELQGRFTTLAKDRCVVDDLIDSSGNNITDSYSSNVEGSTVFPLDSGTKEPTENKVGNEVLTISHSKSGTVHSLTMSVDPSTMLLPLIPVQFKASAAYAEGDTFAINGSSCAAKLPNGEDLYDSLFVSGAVVSCVLEVEDSGMILNFNKGGGKYKVGDTLTASQYEDLYADSFSTKTLLIEETPYSGTTIGQIQDNDKHFLVNNVLYRIGYVGTRAVNIETGSVIFESTTLKHSESGRPRLNAYVSDDSIYILNNTTLSRYNLNGTLISSYTVNSEDFAYDKDLDGVWMYDSTSKLYCYSFKTASIIEQFSITVSNATVTGVDSENVYLYYYTGSDRDEYAHYIRKCLKSSGTTSSYNFTDNTYTDSTHFSRYEFYPWYNYPDSGHIFLYVAESFRNDSYSSTRTSLGYYAIRKDLSTFKSESRIAYTRIILSVFTDGDTEKWIRLDSENDSMVVITPESTGTYTTENATSNFSGSKSNNLPCDQDGYFYEMRESGNKSIYQVHGAASGIRIIG